MKCKFCSSIIGSIPNTRYYNSCTTCSVLYSPNIIRFEILSGIICYVNLNINSKKITIYTRSKEYITIDNFDVSILNPNNIYDTCLRLLKMKAYL